MGVNPRVSCPSPAKKRYTEGVDDREGTGDLVALTGSGTPSGDVVQVEKTGKYREYRELNPVPI